MEHWLLLALLPPLLWSASNMMDEYLARRHFMGNAIAYLAVAYVMELVPAFAVLSVREDVLVVSLGDMLVLLAAGGLAAASGVPYILAIQKNGAALAVPFFQLIPVVIFVLGWLFLGETVSLRALAACLLIIVSAAAVSWNFETRRPGWRLIGLMSLTSVGYALSTVCVRSLGAEYEWPVLFVWAAMGAGLVAAVFLALRPASFGAARTAFKKGGISLAGLFLTQAVFDMGAYATFIAALVLAPAAGLAASVAGIQPFYVFLFSFIFGILFPHSWGRMKADRVMVWRLGCLTFMFAGVFALQAP